MSTSLSKWKVWCETDSKYEYRWDETEPAVCPANAAHTITASATTTVETLGINEVRIKENDTPTGGFYQVECYEIVAAPLTTTTIVYYNHDCDMNVYSVTYKTDDSHRGDAMDITISPNTVVGIVMAPVAAGATTITVSPTALQYLAVGFRVALSDGTNTAALGVVRSMNAALSQITVGTGSAHAFSPLTPTYVKMTVAYTRAPLIFGVPGHFTFGTGKIGGSFIPRSTAISIAYANNSSETKYLVVYAEIDY